MSNLVIVESPAKANTIKGYLGSGYKVVASKGHVRDLPKSTLGVDIENNFEARYINIRGKGPLITELKKDAKNANKVFLATDPDREGEAISWHLANALGIAPENAKRISFNEITKTAVKSAIKDPKPINMDLVNSQQTRRILDRIVGYKASPFLWKTLKSGLSAGRVQSVATRLIVEREEEIKAFVPVEYWTITASLIDTQLKVFKANFYGDKDGRIELHTKEEAEKVFEAIQKGQFKVVSVKKAIKNRNPAPPFTTTTLQQEANNRFKLSPINTAAIAQSLYEGVEINGELIGLITYTRSDATKLSSTYINKTRKFIIENYGEQYFEGGKKAKISMNAQLAHEPIRPTHNSLTPESIRKYLNANQYKIYDLIYKRTLASLMPAKKIETKTVTLSSNGIDFKLKNHKTLFDGYTILYKNSDILEKDNDESVDILNLAVGDELNIVKIDKKQNFTEPPARYSEAKIIGIMEDKGIGRPSTYATTLHTLLDVKRNYVSIKDGFICPSEKGMTVSHVFDKYFSEFISSNYTAEMELDLDKVQDAVLTSLDVLSEFYDKFMKLFQVGLDRIYKEEAKTLGVCPKCGQPLVEKRSKYGTFVACSDYINCKYVVPTEKEPERIVPDRVCPKCGKKLLVKKDKKGKDYVICSNYSVCKYSESNKKKEPVLESDKKCPRCGSTLVYRKVAKGKKKGQVFLGCSNYPKCTYIEDVESK